MTLEHIIIGAGIAGLHLGQKLQAANKSVLILEKSRGVGGRIATRRIEGLGLDHGSPYLPISKETSHLVKTYHLENEIKTNSEGEYFEKGMTKLPKVMAQNLKINLSERVLKIQKVGELWEVETDKNESYHCKNLILTAPLPQSLELLAANHIPVPQILNEIKYHQALIGLFIVEDLPQELAVRNFMGHHLHFSGTRGLHPKGLILRASPEFSSIHFDQDPNVNLGRLKSLAEMMLYQKMNFTHAELKTWRYVQPSISLTEAFHTLADNLFLVGDAFLSPGIRGSILSSEALARQLT